MYRTGSHPELRTGAAAKVEFELQCLLRWRHNAGKPLGPLPWEGAIAKGLLNYLDPSLSDIKGFQPVQLQELLKVAVAAEKSNKFGALRQMSLYVYNFGELRDSLKLKNLR